MRFSITAAATFVAYALAAPIAAPEAQTSSSDGFLAVPLAHNSPIPPSKIPNFAAGDPITVKMINEVMAYFVELELGGQKNKVHIDTGSPFLWVWNSNSDTCQSDEYKDQCASDGSYNPSKSSTSEDLGSSFQIQYGKGHAEGEYYSDTAALGAAKVNKLKFGVDPNNVNEGGFGTVFGIGPNRDDASSFSKQLLNDGVTKRQVYGMSFGEPGDQSSSEVTFGAINTGRFEGNLEKLSYGNDGHFTVKGSGKIGDTEILSNRDVILDSGTSLTFLETDAYYNFIGAIRDAGIQLHDQGQGITAYLCSDADKAPDATFTFGKKEIKVSVKELSIQGSQISSQISDQICILGVALGDGSMNLFGDTFLRSVYTVYDLERQEVHIAQGKRGQANNYKVVTADVPSN